MLFSRSLLFVLLAFVVAVTQAFHVSRVSIHSGRSCLSMAVRYSFLLALATFTYSLCYLFAYEATVASFNI